MKRAARGVTLIEVMITVFILATAVALGTIGIKFIQNLQSQRTILSAQLESQVALYQLTQDVKNANYIVEISSISPHRLVLNSYNFKLGFDVATSPIFQVTHIGTITYQFIESPSNSYLERKAEFDGETKDGRKLLVNLIRPDDPATPEAEYIFAPAPLNASKPYEAVDICFRLAGGFFARNPQVYRAQAMLRSKLGK